MPRRFAPISSLLADRPPDLLERAFLRRRDSRAPSAPRRKPRNIKPFRRPRRSRPGRGPTEGQGRAIPCLPPAPGSLRSTPVCAPIRPPPARCAPAWRFRAPRLQQKSCASTPTKPRCGTSASPPATRSGLRRTCLSLWRDVAGRPPSLDPARLVDAAARLDLAVDPNGLASSLKACAGQGDPVSAAAKAAAVVFSAFPDAPASEAEILALWMFDMVIAIRLRWPRPVPLIAVKILDPTLRAGRRTTTKAGRPSLARRSRRRDRTRRRRRPRPRRRACPPFEHSDRRRAQTAIETGPENRRPHARRRIASRPPKRPATRR